MACSRCNAPNADLFTPAGDLVCRFCFNAEQTAQADARARASLEQDAPPGFKMADPGAAPPSPRRMIAGGCGVIAFAFLFAIGTAVAFDHVYPIWFGLLLLGGATSVVRGVLLLRKR